MTHPDLARKLYKASPLARLPRQSMLCGLLTYFTLVDARALFQPDFLRLALAEGETAERFARYIPTGLTDPLAQLMAAESLHYDFLHKVDVASSAHGLEVRTPFVDVEVFNFAMRLPMTLKVRPGTLKVLLRLLARRLLPASVIDRPKQGFAIPFDRWAGPKLREFLLDLLLSPTARCRDWLHPARVEAILQVFASNTRPVYLSRFQASHHVFLLAAFELWLRRWSPSAEA
jgi:asparagine synthase (glutamine-hydrolysing)